MEKAPTLHRAEALRRSMLKLKAEERMEAMMMRSKKNKEEKMKTDVNKKQLCMQWTQSFL